MVRTARRVAPFRVDLRHAVPGALVRVRRQRLAVALLPRRALAHVQQARPIFERKNTILAIELTFHIIPIFIRNFHFSFPFSTARWRVSFLQLPLDGVYFRFSHYFSPWNSENR